MNRAIDRLATSIFNKSLDECSEAELQSLTQQYPWFAPAQLLYAKKLKQSDSPLYDDQLQKTSLYFQNRLWLQHLLDQGEEEEAVTIAPAVFPMVIPTEPVAPAEPVEEAAINEAVERVQHVSTTGEETSTVEMIDIPAEPVETIAAVEETASDTVESAEVASDTPVETPVLDKIDMPAATAEVTSPATEPTEDANVTGDSEKKDEPELVIPGLKIEPMDNNTQLTFEPYHTVDYFASQGIKVKEDDKPADRFGHQLKSFTEWLKTLKRLPSAEMAKVGADPAGEKKVEQLAEHSLAERHVITEAMAEVWIKQGNKVKAEEIYRKLSLLEPSKTAYFAAKIEDLKKTS